MAQDDRTFRTSTPEANRAETQGLGVGQRELDAQRSPGDPEGLDELIEEDLEDGETPSRRGLKTEAERGQGAKTRAANKDIVSRRG
jgi:hypothetical protein